MVLTMDQLKQLVFCHAPVPTGRGGTQPHAFGLQGVPRTTGVRRGRGASKAYQRAPSLKASSTTASRSSLRSGGSSPCPLAAAQGVESLLGPGFHMVQPMIRLRGDVGQPEDRAPPQAEPHPLTMGGGAFI